MQFTKVNMPFAGMLMLYCHLSFATAGSFDVPALSEAEEPDFGSLLEYTLITPTKYKVQAEEIAPAEQVLQAFVDIIFLATWGFTPHLSPIAKVGTSNMIVRHIDFALNNLHENPDILSNEIAQNLITISNYHNSRSPVSILETSTSEGHLVKSFLELWPNGSCSLAIMSRFPGKNPYWRICLLKGNFYYSENMMHTYFDAKYEYQGRKLRDEHSSRKDKPILISVLNQDEHLSAHLHVNTFHTKNRQIWEGPMSSCPMVEPDIVKVFEANQ